MNSEKLKQLLLLLNREVRPSPKAKLLAALLVFALFQFFRTYMKWPDPIVDFGREIYVPWRLFEGEALLRDIPYFQGPLSPWVNALWFRMFGVGLLTLAVANFFIFLGILFLLFEILERIADRFAAFWGCFLVIAVFGFGQYLTTGNYNFITPYSHEITHGMFLSLLGMVVAHRLWKIRAKKAGIFLGFVLGSLFLTKPEMFAAGFAGVAALFGYELLSDRSAETRRWALASACRSFLGFTLTLGAALFALSRSNDRGTAFKGTLGGFFQLIDARVTSNPFQAWVSGFDNIPSNLIIACAMALAWLVFTLAGKFVDRWLSKQGWRSTSGIIALVSIFFILSLGFQLIPFSLLPRGIPIFVIALVFVLRPGGRNELAKTVSGPHRALAFAFAVFSFVILLRVILRFRFMHYGFAFALPASVLLVALIGCWIPRILYLRHKGGFLAKAMLVYMVLAFSFFHYRVDQFYSSPRIIPVSEREEDAFLLGPPYVQIFSALNQAINQRIKPGESLVVIPEGVMINYLHRHHSPGGYTSYLPVVFDIFGEEKILNDFGATPPDFVLYYYVSGVEWGRRDFGRDYGVELGKYIRDNYESAWQIGAQPFDGSGNFGMELLKRKPKP